MLVKMKIVFTVMAIILILDGCSSDITEGNYLYCQMVAEWERDTAKGVPFDDRGGWPPYDESVTCLSTQ